ncbi:MAG: hypothetical protein EB069_04820 [Actinobacteria bacterium]|nr:hypothetical protein [Actinomycetota bacterium]
MKRQAILFDRVFSFKSLTFSPFGSAIRHKIAIMKYLLAAIALSAELTFGHRSVFANDGMLVTLEEAETARSLSPHPRPRAVVLPDAPRIVFTTPDLSAPIAVPASMEIRFVSAGSADIVPDSFRAFYGIRKWDITDRLLRIGSLSKFGLMASSVSLPPGEHHVTFSISDTFGRQALQNFKITVR